MEHVREVLHFRHMKQGEIARALSLSQPSFSQMCQGNTGLPLHLVKPLSLLLNVKVDRVVDAFSKVWEDNQDYRKEAGRLQRSARRIRMSA